MAKPTRVEVVWDDAHGDALRIVSDIDLPHRPTVMQTMGWLLRDDEVGVSVANERCLDDGDDSYRGHTFIPRSLVRSVTVIKVTSPRKKKEIPSDA